MKFLKFVFEYFYLKITREVIPVPGDIKLIAGQWHLVHFASSFLLAWIFNLIFPAVPLLIPCSIISLFFLLSELHQLRGNWTAEEIKDSVTDFIQYQGCWAFAFGLVPFLVIAILYLLTLKWSKP
jgi:hypothetical protein